MPSIPVTLLLQVSKGEELLLYICWTGSSMAVSASFVLGRPEPDTALQMCLTSTEYSGVITALGMLAELLSHTSQDVASI